MLLSTASTEYPLVFLAGHDRFHLPHLFSGILLCPISAKSPVQFWWPKARPLLRHRPDLQKPSPPRQKNMSAKQKRRHYPRRELCPSSWLADVLLVRRLLSCSPLLGASSILPRLRPRKPRSHVRCISSAMLHGRTTISHQLS
jgi:hypothetical protein